MFKGSVSMREAVCERDSEWWKMTFGIDLESIHGCHFIASVGKFMSRCPWGAMLATTLLQPYRLLVHWEAESHQKVSRDASHSGVRQTSCVLCQRALRSNSDKRINLMPCCSLLYHFRQLNSVSCRASISWIKIAGLLYVLWWWRAQKQMEGLKDLSLVCQPRRYNFKGDCSGE